MSLSSFPIVFFGTPEFAIPSLEAVLSLENVTVAAVVTETDKPSGRGHKIRATPIKQWALENGLTVLQPNSLRGVSPSAKVAPDESDREALALRELLSSTKPHIGITVAYGKILPRSLITYPTLGIVNVHASLLPRWRGAAPLQHAILSGDTHSGVALMQTEYELDTGAVFHEEKIALAADETLGSLHNRLMHVGAHALRSALPNILLEKITPVPQPSTGITYAEKWTIEDSTINWRESYTGIDRRVRASAPVPGARTEYFGTMVKIFEVEQIPNLSYTESVPGTIVDVQRKKIVVACGNGEFLAPVSVQLAGRKRMSIDAAMQGFSFSVGEKFQ